MPWPVTMLAAALLFGGAALTAPEGPRDIGLLGRRLVRPAVLPFVWSGLADARRRASVGEVVTRARTLMRFLPRWVDGHVYFAWELALDTSALDVEVALDRLEAACLLLEEAATLCPERAEEVFVARAVLLEVRARDVPGLAARFVERIGRTPLEAADADLARAEQRASVLEVRVQRAYLAARMIGPPLAAGDREQAAALTAGAIEQLTALAPVLRAGGDPAGADAAVDYARSLARLGEWLRGEGGHDPATLARDPLLEEFFTGR